MSVFSSKSTSRAASRAARRACVVQVHAPQNVTHVTNVTNVTNVTQLTRVPPIAMVSWSIARCAALRIARLRGIAWNDSGPELELRALLLEAPGSATVRLVLVDPAAPSAADVADVPEQQVIIAEATAVRTFDASGALVGVVAADSRGTLLDATLTHGRRAIFARTELFARFGIDGGRYELA